MTPERTDECGELRSDREHGGSAVGAAEWLFLIVVMAVALGLRLYGIRRESPWFDEIVSLRFLHLPSLFDFLRSERSVDPPMMPLYFTLQYGWSRLFGTDISTLRVMSALFSVCTVPMVYLLGRRMFGPLAGVVAALCQTFSLSSILYAQELRMYSLVGFLTVCSAYFLVRALASSGRWWWAHAAMNALLMATHMYAILYVVAVGAFLLLRFAAQRLGSSLKVEGKGFVFWILTNAFLFALWCLWVSRIDYSALQVAARWIPMPHYGHVKLLFLVLIGAWIQVPIFQEYRISALTTGSQWHADTVLAWTFTVLIALFLLRGAVGVLLRCRSPKACGEAACDCASSVAATGSDGPEFQWPTIFLLAWIAIPLLALLAASVLYRPTLVDRYVLYVSPALHLLFGAAVWSLGISAGKGLGILMRRGVQCLAVVAVVVAFLTLFLTLPKPWRADWQAVGGHIVKESAGAEIILPANAVEAVALVFNTPALQDRICRERPAFLPEGDYWVGPIYSAPPEKGAKDPYLVSAYGPNFVSYEVPGLDSAVFLHVHSDKGGRKLPDDVMR